VGVSSSAPACSCCGFLCFFFSSRRRHTRFSRDWSSDVCSSDLAARAVISNHMGPKYGSHWYLQPKLFQRGYRHQALLDSIRSKRSEERRVGKEWRYGGGGEDGKEQGREGEEVKDDSYALSVQS